jgi:hypothetical protein
LRYNITLKVFFTLLSCIFVSCSSDTPTEPEEPGSPFNLIFNVENGALKFEVWSATANELKYGYNEIGFKVFNNGVEQKNGYVIFNPIMYHGIGGPSHAMPVRDKFLYNNETGLFHGYVVFLMYDTTAFFAVDYNYNNSFFIDSVVFQIGFNERSQIKVWDNFVTEKTYVLTLLSPLSPGKGQHDFELMLHSTDDMMSYEEVNNAEMFIEPKHSSGAGSVNNLNPVSTGGAKYLGRINLDKTGLWQITDSISYNGLTLTKTPPPKFTFNIN